MPSEALHSAVDWLLDHQDAQGWWSGELETNVTMTAEHVLLLRFLGVSHDDIREGAIRHMLGAQREDGSWALYHDGPGDLSTTIEAYVALRVLGVDATRPELRRALRMILDQGGIVEARVFTKIWLALFGIYPWDGVPSMPPELVRLPSWAPLNLYDFACWARGTIAPLLIVISRRPVRDLGVDVERGDRSRKRASDASRRGIGRVPVARSSAQGLRPAATPAGTRLVAPQARHVDHRPAGGRRWMGRHPAAVGLFTDRAQPRGHVARSPGDAARARGISAVQHRRPATDCASSRACRRCGTRRGRCSRLRKAGVPRDHPALRRAVDWLLAEQIIGWRRLAGQGAAARMRRLGLRVRQRHLPGRRRHRRRGARAARVRGDPDRCRSRSKTRCAGAGRCVRATVRGRHSTRTTRAPSCTSCPSPTSAPCSTRPPRT